MEIGEVSLLVQKFGAKNQFPLLDRLWQAESRLERSFTRAQRELERLQKSRREQPHEQPVVPAPANIGHPTPDISHSEQPGRLHAIPTLPVVEPNTGLAP